MKIQNIIAAVAALTCATLADPSTLFTLTVVSSESAIHGKSVNPNDGIFLINEDSNFTCDPSVVCPNSVPTIFSLTDQSLELNVRGPFRQKVSAGSTDSVYDAVTFDMVGSSPIPHGNYNDFSLDVVNGYLKFGGADLYACPVLGELVPSYMVYVDNGVKPYQECVSFKAAYYSTTPGLVWQYI